MPDEKTSHDRRAALEAGYEKIDAASPPPLEVPPPPVVPPPGDGKVAEPKVAEPAKVEGGEPAPGRDEKGRFVPKAPSEGPPPLEPKVVEPKQLELVPPPVEPEVKPPTSWRVSEREAWAKIPKEARDPILRREKETEEVLRKSAEARENWGRFVETVRPYEYIMRMNGSADPVESAANLFRTAALLQTGTPFQQAQTVAQVIQQFNVDPGMVASFLEGQPPAQQQQQQFRDPRLDQFLATVEQSKRQKEEQEAQEIQGRLETFGQTHEFFEDVRDTMADLVDTWEAQGKLSKSDLSGAMERAYNLAILMHEDVAKMVKQKEAAKAAQDAIAAAQKAKAAASSVRSSPAAAGGAAQPTDRRSVLAQRYDELDVK